jgi:hypothetical protein
VTSLASRRCATRLAVEPGIRSARQEDVIDHEDYTAALERAKALWVDLRPPAQSADLPPRH